jgi:UDP-N-acetylmuramoylalanine--D-glutamate ligase
MQLRGKRVLVMGLGVHGGGLGVARWLLRQGAQLTITDMASAEQLAAPLAALEQAEQTYQTRITYVLGEHRAEDFADHEVVVANPAVPPDSPWLARARAAGAQVETEMTLFFRACPGPILGITGTKGKTTTTLLTGAILRQRYPETVIAGNLRVSALEALDQIGPTTPVVLELSSFQLVGLGAAGLSPRYACVTNLSPDHLNYHGSMAAYARAKQQIFLHQSPQGVALLQAELLAQPDWQAAAAACAGRVQTFHAEPGAQPGAQPDAQQPADYQISAAGQLIYQDTPLLDVAAIQLVGRHNQANVLAAVALAHSFGCAAEPIRAAVRDFRGVEHRLERVRTLDAVQYVNDTTATNPAAAQAALHSFAAPLVLLAGGADKQLPLEALAASIVQRVRVLVLLAGSATPRLHQAVLAAQAAGAHELLVLGPYDDFAAAIRAARAAARAGEVVLLSPGCASFGMFHNEFHRGDEFRRIVQHELEAD